MPSPPGHLVVAMAADRTGHHREALDHLRNGHPGSVTNEPLPTWDSIPTLGKDLAGYLAVVLTIIILTCTNDLGNLPPTDLGLDPPGPGHLCLSPVQKAPFGRHTRPGWGPTLPNAWGWVIMEFSRSPASCCPSGKTRPSRQSRHLLHGGPVHAPLPASQPGLSRLSPHPGQTHAADRVLSAITFNAVNGTFFGTWFGTFADYDASWWQDTGPFGLLLFLVGAAINVRSDYQLIALRKGSETGYTIPHGGFFRWVSCPQSLRRNAGMEQLCPAHLVPARTGLRLLDHCQCPPRSLAHHAWYRAFSRLSCRAGRRFSQCIVGGVEEGGGRSPGGRL